MLRPKGIVRFAPLVVTQELIPPRPRENRKVFSSATMKVYDFSVPKIPKVGQKVQVRLPTGKEVEGVVREILTTNSGPRLRMEYGSGVATINVVLVIWKPGRVT